MKNLFRNIFSRPLFQAPFELLLSLSLKALNIGDGQSVGSSGEMSVCHALERYCTKEIAMIFDVGAHTGEWATLFSTTYKGKAVMYSFEPSRESFASLSSLSSPTLIAENIALGDRIGEMLLGSDTNGSVDSRVIDPNDDLSARPLAIESISMTTIDAYARQHEIDEIDLLKLDIEGYELKALSGASDMISGSRIGLIQFEFGAPSSEKYTLKYFFDLLSPRYVICRILKNGLYPLPEYNHMYEIHTVSNFLAIRKDLYHA